MTIQTTPHARRTGIALLSLTLAAVPGGAVFAQGAAAGDDEPIEEIITIGTPGGGGVERQQASFALTTISADDITKFSPKSTGDLMKTVPGVWAESSGGKSGANIDVRGLPGGENAPFLTLAINGSPIYGTQSLSFFEQSTIFRVDETIAGAEALRGGPNAVFGKGEPGVTVNFKLKEGSELTEGRVKYTTSDYGLQRFDGVLSGELAENLYYMVGGYFSSSEGIRDPQFQAEQGEQFTINLNRVFSNGEINFFVRRTDDFGQWSLNFPLGVGLNDGEFTQLGNATRFRELQVDINGDTEIFDFGRGRGWDGTVAGGSAEFEFGDGWTVRDQFTITSGDADTFGIVPSGGEVPVPDLEAVIGGPVMTESGMTLSSADYVQTWGHWVVFKDIESKINDISINKQFQNHDLTFGFYQATWSSDDWWSIGNPIPMHLTKNGEILDSSITVDDMVAAGGGGGFMFGIQSAGDARADAFYIADSWYVSDQWRIDAGVRFESTEIDYVLDSSPDGFSIPDGVLDSTTELDDDDTAVTVAVNYDVNDSLGLYGRYSDGIRFPHFDDLRQGREKANAVEQWEAGVKYRGERFEVYGTAYFNTADLFSADLGSVIPPGAFQSEAIGIEADAAVFLGPLTLDLLLTLQDTEITNADTEENEGNQVRRQPEFQARVAPSYDFTMGDWDGSIYAAFSFVGDRFQDNANTAKLPSYEKVDLGVLLYHESGLFFQLHGDNITDSDGITEGDPRDPSSPNGRPIFGRSVNFSVGYDFGD